jgi:lysine-arginine-ornithine-binding protein
MASVPHCFRSLALAAAILLIFAGGVARADKIRVGNEGDFKPFSFSSADGTLQGFDIDVAHEICRRMSAECEITAMDFKGLIPALRAGKIDLIVSSVDITDERRKQVLFSKPYYFSPYSFLALKGKEFEISKAGLQGKTIGVVATGAQRKWLEKYYGDVATIKLYDTPADVRADMLNGRLDGTIANMPYLYGAFMQGDLAGRFSLLGEPIRKSEFFGDGTGICTQLGNDALIKRVNDAIDAMYADGTFKRINDKYFPFYLGAQ